MTEQFLDQIDRCIICPEGTILDKNPLTQDHVFPLVARKGHRSILEWVLTDKGNLVKVCIKDHSIIDRTKIGRYRSKGLIGLVDYIAKDYPRSPDIQLRDQQHNQFLRLLSLFYENLTGQNGNINSGLREEYLRVADHVDRLIYQLNKGNF